MALIGYQTELSRIEHKMAEIRSQLGSRVIRVVAKKGGPTRTLSVAARARIAAAQRKRWAQFHKSKKAAAVPEVPKAKRRISEEGMKRIIAATKKRWAAKRAAAKPEPVVTKKVTTKKLAGKKAAGKAAPVEAVKRPASSMTENLPEAPNQ